MPKDDPRIDLIIAYREAGLAEKADELVAEMLEEHVGVPVTGIPAGKTFHEISAKLDDAMDKLSAQLGIPRRPRKRKP